MYLFGEEGDIECALRVLLRPQDRREAAGNEGCRYERSLHAEQGEQSDTDEVLKEVHHHRSNQTLPPAPGSKQFVFD